MTDASTAAEALRPVFARRFLPANQRVWAANRVFMPTLPEELPAVSGLLQRRPDGISEERWSAVLGSHLIDGPAQQLLLADDVAGFIERRQDRVTRELRLFLGQKCEWGFENTPPLSDLELDDLDDDDAA